MSRRVNMRKQSRASPRLLRGSQSKVEYATHVPLCAHLDLYTPLPLSRTCPTTGTGEERTAVEESEQEKGRGNMLVARNATHFSRAFRVSTYRV